MAFERLGGFLGNLGNLVFKGQDTPISEPVRQASDYDEMMNDMMGQYGRTREDLEGIMNKIGHHESAGTMDPSIHQYGGGPGRGIYQYETGANQGGITARNRLARWFKSKMKDIPEWLSQENMDTEGFDASKLTPEQQNMLFLADKRYHPTASLSAEDTSDLSGWWARNHWAGGNVGTDLYDKKVAAFQDSEESIVDDVVTEQGQEAY